LIPAPPSLLLLALLSGRIALVASSSQADGQPTLRYPGRDADRVAAVLSELGSFAPADVWSLPRASAADLRRALDRAEAIAAREPGSAIVLYYSGHADGAGLLMGGDRFSYEELRARLARSRATVRVAVLDACNAGGAAQTKGGRPATGAAAAATFEPVAPAQARGAAIIAASTADELAQESNEVGGSYFTYYLVSALRGAADRDGDGVVTLGEAYAYAYAHTVAATAPSLWGPQHPSYDYRLSGAGELALTTLRRARQALLFAPDAGGGAYTILDAGRDVVAEVRADARRAARLALAPGRYRIAYRAGERIYGGEVTLPPGADVAVDRAALREVRPEYATAKGAGGRGGAVGPALFADYALVGRGPSATGVSTEVAATFRYGLSRWALAERASYGETSSNDLGIALRLRRLTAGTYVLRRAGLGPLELQYGGAVTLTYAIEDTPSRRFTGFIPGGGGALALELPLAWRAALRLGWDAGVELLPVDGSVQARPALRAALGIGVRP
jgi:hypothetical protein